MATVETEFAAPPALAGPATLHRGGGGSNTTVSGVYSVTLNLNVASTIPAGAAGRATSWEH